MGEESLQGLGLEPETNHVLDQGQFWLAAEVVQISNHPAWHVWR